MNRDPKEFNVKAPWGNIALMAWGDPSQPPVLMLHGRQDSAATFVPLVALLPPTKYYVGVDLPGHGKSECYPKGLALSRYHFIAVIEYVVRALRWKSFIFMGHSMGCELGLFYNATRPGMISRFVHIDVGPSFQRLQHPDQEYFYKHYYHRYYSNYHSYNHRTKDYSKRQVLDAVKKARGLTEQLAELVLSRNLIQIGEDTYRLSWDSRSKYVAPQNTTNDYYTPLFITNQVPSLLITLSDGSAGVTRGKDGADELIRGMLEASPLTRVFVDGGHDLHLTDPRKIAGFVTDFLNKDFGVKSKM